MLHLFGSLKGLLKTKRISIDHTVFQLHYKCTVLMLLVFCVIVTTKQFAGDPIKCTGTKHLVSAALDDYCWISTTYTIEVTNSDEEGPHPGIIPPRDGQERRHHKYYQWVGLVLFLQAILFYTPRWLWKTWEGGRVAWLLSVVDVRFTSEDDRILRKRCAVDYVRSNWGLNSWYTAKYCFCEVLAFFNVVGQMFLLNFMMDGAFIHYGLEMIHFLDLGEEKRTDPMVRLFPRVASCTFLFFGPAGKLNSIHVLCVLPVNVINEKIYIFLWFWFVVLAALSSCALVFRAVTLAFPLIRLRVLQSRFAHVKAEYLNLVVSRGSAGDWFFLHLVGQNMDQVHFRQLLMDVAIKISQPKVI